MSNVTILLLVAGVGVGVFFLTRRSGNATQADEAAGIINAIGNLGKGIGADTTTNMQADVYTFAKTAGLFGGVSFEGAGIIKKDDWNRAYYGQGATPRGIVMENKFKNPNTQALLKSLQPY